jgi:hypothetical protein
MIITEYQRGGGEGLRCTEGDAKFYFSYTEALINRHDST